MEIDGKTVKIVQFLSLNLMADWHTCLDIEVEDVETGERSIVHVPSPEPLEVIHGNL